VKASTIARAALQMRATSPEMILRIADAVREHGSLGAAAAALGMSRRTLTRMVAECDGLSATLAIIPRRKRGKDKRKRKRTSRATAPTH